MILWLLAYCFLYLGFSVLSFTNEHMYMNSVIKKLNALDRSVMKQQRQGDLLRWLGGPNSVVRHVWGGSIEGEEEKKKASEGSYLSALRDMRSGYLPVAPPFY